MEVNAQMANVSSEQENIQMFYREQNELLFRYAMQLTGDRHQAEEALQTAWCQCLTYRETFFRVPEEKRPAWMRTVVRHAVYAQYQKTRHLVPLDPAWDGPAPEQGSVEEIHSLDAGEIPRCFGIEVCFGVEGREDRREAGNISWSDVYQNIPWAAASPGATDSGGLCRWIPMQKISGRTRKRRTN